MNPIVQKLIARIESMEDLSPEDIALVLQLAKVLLFPEVVRALAYRNGVTVDAEHIELVDNRTPVAE